MNRLSVAAWLIISITLFATSTVSADSWGVTLDGYLLPKPKYSRIRGGVREEMPSAVSGGLSASISHYWPFLFLGGGIDYLRFSRGSYVITEDSLDDITGESEENISRAPLNDTLGFSARFGVYADLGPVRVRAGVKTGITMFMLDDPEYGDLQVDPGWLLSGGTGIGWFVVGPVEIRLDGGYLRQYYFTDFPERFFTGWYISLGAGFHF